MARYINPTDIISLVLKGKTYIITKYHQKLLNDEYSIDSFNINLKLLEYTRILVKALEHEFTMDDSSDITYDLYLKLIQIVDNDYIETYLMDNGLQYSNNIYNSVINNYYGQTNRFRSVFLVDEDDVTNIELTTDIDYVASGYVG
jgi:hypothetical protein